MTTELRPPSSGEIVHPEFIKNLIGNIYLLPSEDPHTENCNVFALIHEKKVALFDCGNLRNLSRIERSLAVIGLGLSDIKVIFMTDIHSDHAGCAKSLQTANPDIEVAVPENGIKPMQSGDWDKTCWYLYPHLNQSYAYPLPRIDVSIPDRYSTCFGPHTINAVWVPSHTPYSTAYIIDQEFMVGGDMINGGFNTERIGSNLADWKTSFAKLNAYPFRFFVDGHAPAYALPFPRSVYHRAWNSFGKESSSFVDLVNLWG